MAYPTTTPSSPQQRSAPAGKDLQQRGFTIASDAPSRFGIRSVIVIAISLMAIAVSLYRISDTMREETPQHSPMQDLLKANPEYAALISAIRDHDSAQVRALLTKNPALANFNKDGLAPPLLLASVSDQPEMVDALIDAGADINAKGRWGATVLHWAAWRGSANSVSELIRRGADINALSDNDSSTPLFWACRGSHEAFFGRDDQKEVVQILLDAGASPEITNKDGFSATSIASEEVAALLVANGAKAAPPATQPTFGQLPAHDHPWGWGFGHHYSHENH